MDIRHSQLVLISKRVKKANDKINEILEKLNWTREDLKQWQNERKKLQTCPFDKRHVVPELTMIEHYRHCLLKSRGIVVAKKAQKTKLSPTRSSLFFHKDSSSVISFIDPQDQQNINEPHKNIIDTTLLLPQQAYYVKELEPIPSMTEKCQAYDQVIQRSNQLRHHHHHHHLIISLNNEIDRLVFEKQKKQKKKSHEEQQQLDKRRRKQYRVKMKMITPKEIQRELIHAYMQEYKQWSETTPTK